jgi:hypothetical protein
MLSENQLFANRYRLVKRLGQGAFSEVWKAEDTKAGTRASTTNMREATV